MGHCPFVICEVRYGAHVLSHSFAHLERHALCIILPKTNGTSCQSLGILSKVQYALGGIVSEDTLHEEKAGRKDGMARNSLPSVHLRTALKTS